MCGKALEEETPFGEPATDAPPEETRAPAVLQPARPVAPEPPAPAPAYTGGLFNLGASGDTPSRNLDYLLEDDEPRSGKGLLLLAVVAVALVVGLGWLRFRHSGIPGLRSWGAHTAPAGQNEGGPASPVPPSANSEPNPPSTSRSPSTPEGNGADLGNPAPATGPVTPSPANSAPVPGSSGPAASGPVTPTPATPTPATPTPTPATTAPGTNVAPATVPSSGSPESGEGASGAGDAKGQSPQAPGVDHDAAQSAVKDRAAAPAEPPAEDLSAPAVVKPTKKVAKPVPGKPEDRVTLGEKYLYGRGVPQSCDKGLSYVKPAAEKSNAKAMITMGALYATGHCLSRDLPTAYRYFALALRQDPENGALKQNAEMVWGQMTPSERQLAIRMTQ